MVTAFALAVLALTQQDPGLNVSPRVKAMLGQFPPPSHGEVSLSTRFSNDTVFPGEQVELVVAAWFPRDLRDQLRRAPSFRAPMLSGLWSAQAGGQPVPIKSILVGSRIYDLYVMPQTLFPLAAGVVTAPPAELSYAVPRSSSFFAPEDPQVLLTKPVNLYVRTIPSELLTELGDGPTARDLTVIWRGPVNGLRSGTPAAIELVVRGSGNVTLWPDPQITWPGGIRVYPERTEQNVRMLGGLVSGEKRFRFTVVPDSAGVLSLPAVSYPFFDPNVRRVIVATAPAFAFPVVAGSGATNQRAPLPIGVDTARPLATDLMQRFGFAFFLAALFPPLHWIWRRRRRAPVVVREAPIGDPELELRRLLGTPIDAGPDRVTHALRQRGIAREEAEAVRLWLVSAARKRYGPTTPAGVPPADVLVRVVSRLREVTKVATLLLLAALPLTAQQDGPTRYRGGDFTGAARIFSVEVQSNPLAPIAWRNLGAAEWATGDDVGAAASFINALSLAPRDPVSRRAWREASNIPQQIRGLAPVVPLNRDELLLAGIAVWLLAWVAWLLRWRRIAYIQLAFSLTFLVLGGLRWVSETQPRVVLREGARLHISPAQTSPLLGNAPAWTIARVLRKESGWYLVDLGKSSPGWVSSSAAAQIGFATFE